jgi:hypothetical protein
MRGFSPALDVRAVPRDPRLRWNKRDPRDRGRSASLARQVNGRAGARDAIKPTPASIQRSAGSAPEAVRPTARMTVIDRPSRSGRVADGSVRRGRQRSRVGPTGGRPIPGVLCRPGTGPSREHLSPELPRTRGGSDRCARTRDTLCGVLGRRPCVMGRPGPLGEW